MKNMWFKQSMAGGLKHGSNTNICCKKEKKWTNKNYGFFHTWSKSTLLGSVCARNRNFQISWIVTVSEFHIKNGKDRFAADKRTISIIFPWNLSSADWEEISHFTPLIKISQKMHSLQIQKIDSKISIRVIYIQIIDHWHIHQVVGINRLAVIAAYVENDLLIWVCQLAIGWNVVSQLTYSTR